MKGIIFSGCSFTWGQGLYYYSGLSTLREPLPDHYDSSLVTDAHIKYMSSIRYPRLVSNHFNTFEVCQRYNGGSEDTTIVFLEELFNLSKPKVRTDESYRYEEIEYIIIQTSQPHRNRYFYTKNGKEYDFCVDNSESKKDFYEWLFEIKRSSYDEWFKELVSIEFEKIKTAMLFYESKGIKTRILSWENDYLPLFDTDEWMKERFIPLYKDGVRYECIRDLMNTNRHLTINSDFENFTSPPKDHHPSALCHKIMANSVIKRIESDIENEKSKSITYERRLI